MNENDETDNEKLLNSTSLFDKLSVRCFYNRCYGCVEEWCEHECHKHPHEAVA